MLGNQINFAFRVGCDLIIKNDFNNNQDRYSYLGNTDNLVDLTIFYNIIIR